MPSSSAFSQKLRNSGRALSGVMIEGRVILYFTLSDNGNGSPPVFLGPQTRK